MRARQVRLAEANHQPVLREPAQEIRYLGRDGRVSLADVTQVVARGAVDAEYGNPLFAGKLENASIAVPLMTPLQFVTGAS